MDHPVPDKTATAESAAIAAIRVLLVDDQPIVAQAIRNMLAGSADIAFEYCQDPGKAITTANEYRPTVILQDLVMPDIDGTTLVRFYRHNPSTADVPIIVLSSKEDPEIKRSAFDSGANDYLVKLPHATEVVARIRYHSKAYNDSRILKETVRKLEQTQGQLQQSEKMASVGQLAAGVAHEINNPIGFITSNFGTLNRYIGTIFTLVEEYEALEGEVDAASAVLGKIHQLKKELDWAFLKEDISDLVSQSTDGLTRVKNIVQDLKNFSQVDAAEWQDTDINKGLDSTLALAEHVLGGKTEVIRDYGQLPQVECIPAQINQAVMNILVNAVQAIETSGTITLRTGTHDDLGRADPAGALPDLVQVCAAQELVWLEIADTGKGIEPDHLPKIFDPFFTTRPIGKGTGLGLSVAYGIINTHGGRIGVRSNPGAGSNFGVVLPVRQVRG